ncbi:hypothetical protein BDD12DRAFT_860231 [Trichophaea hybrida]|nr:hypothetical protein BDD12DRAFT_860231 [Trichophaea hybrida]
MPWFCGPCLTLNNPDTRAHCTKCGAPKSATPTYQRLTGSGGRLVPCLTPVFY